MKRLSVLMLIGILFSAAAFAEGFPVSSQETDQSKADSASETKQSANSDSPDPFFVVEAGEDTSSESLNRISGKYDLGFAAPSQTYKSENQYHAGALGRKEPKSNVD